MDWRSEDRGAILLLDVELGVDLVPEVTHLLNVLPLLVGELVLKTVDLLLLSKEVEMHYL